MVLSVERAVTFSPARLLQNHRRNSARSPPVIPCAVSPLTSKTITARFTPTLPRSYDYARLATGSDDPDEPVVEFALGGAAK
jgi:hypothetical protein